MLPVCEPYIGEYGAKNNLNHLAPCILVSSSPDMPGISISSSQLTRLGGRREALSRFDLEPELTAPTKLCKTAPTGVPCISSSGSTFDSPPFFFFFLPLVFEVPSIIPQWKWWSSKQESCLLGSLSHNVVLTQATFHPRPLCNACLKMDHYLHRASFSRGIWYWKASQVAQW